MKEIKENILQIKVSDNKLFSLKQLNEKKMNELMNKK